MQINYLIKHTVTSLLNKVNMLHEAVTQFEIAASIPRKDTHTHKQRGKRR